MRQHAVFVLAYLGDQPRYPGHIGGQCKRPVRIALHTGAFRENLFQIAKIHGKGGAEVGDPLLQVWFVPDQPGGPCKIIANTIAQPRS